MDWVLVLMVLAMVGITISQLVWVIEYNKQGKKIRDQAREITQKNITIIKLQSRLAHFEDEDED